MNDLNLKDLKRYQFFEDNNSESESNSGDEDNEEESESKEKNIINEKK